LGFWLWLLPPKAKSSTKRSKSHMCFCAKAAFSTVQIQKNLHPYFHWLSGQKNTTLPLIMYITIRSFPLLSQLPPILAAQRPHLRATAPSGSSPASRGPLYPHPWQWCGPITAVARPTPAAAPAPVMQTWLQWCGR
jgi:hypothetical protein